jgi:pimeloyl-ACP methyl ester carboxylesterase
MKARLCLAAVVTAALGCGTHGADLARTAATAGKTVFVVSGGFFSCKGPWSEPTGTNTYTNFAPLMATAASDAPTYVATCFGLGHDSLWYQTDADTTTQESTPDHYVDVVAARLAAAGPGARLALVGHSWGAWLALANAERLSRLAPVAYLASIDPISWPDCPPSYVAAAIVDGSSEGDPDPECQMAPPDLTTRYETIAAAANRWDHFYQDRFAYLHSGPIAAATTSTRIPYDDLSPESSWEAHGDMDRDERVYGAIGAALR